MEIEKLKQAVMYPSFSQPNYPPPYYSGQQTPGMGASMLGIPPPQYDMRQSSPDMYGQGNMGIPMRSSNSPR